MSLLQHVEILGYSMVTHIMYIRSEAREKPRNLHCMPQCDRVGQLSRQQAGEGVVGRPLCPLGLTTSGLGAGEHLLSRNQIVDVVFVSTFGGFILHDLLVRVVFLL